MRNKFGKFIKGHKLGFKKGCHASLSTEFKKGQRKGSKKDKFTSDGYVLIYKPLHPKAHDKYVRRSRFIIEKHLNRYLKSNEIVHHINGIKTDDKIENLKLFRNRSEHQKLHRRETICPHCNRKFFINNF